MAPAKRRAGWRKSTYSGFQNGCVEVDLTNTGAQSRRSKIAGSPVISFTADQWSAWLIEVTTDHLTNTNVTVSPDAWTVRCLDTAHTLAFDESERTAFRLGATDGEFDHALSRELAST
jgi:Domain of unknown function (DUF397)